MIELWWGKTGYIVLRKSWWVLRAKVTYLLANAYVDYGSDVAQREEVNLWIQRPYLRTQPVFNSVADSILNRKNVMD